MSNSASNAAFGNVNSLSNRSTIPVSDDYNGSAPTYRTKFCLVNTTDSTLSSGDKVIVVAKGSDGNQNYLNFYSPAGFSLAPSNPTKWTLTIKSGAPALINLSYASGGSTYYMVCNKSSNNIGLSTTAPTGDTNIYVGYTGQSMSNMYTTTTVSETALSDTDFNKAYYGSTSDSITIDGIAGYTYTVNGVSWTYPSNGIHTFNGLAAGTKYPVTMYKKASPTVYTTTGETVYTNSTTKTLDIYTAYATPTSSQITDITRQAESLSFTIPSGYQYQFNSFWISISI